MITESKQNIVNNPLPQNINQIKKDILSYEYSQAKESFNNNIKSTISQSDKLPVLINNSPVFIEKNDKGNVFIPLNKGENLPDYLVGKIANKEFTFIKDINGNNILIPKLKVDSSVIKDINNLISVKDDKGEEKVFFKDPTTDKIYLLPKSRHDIDNLFKNQKININPENVKLHLPDNTENNVIIGKDSNDNPIIIINKKINKANPFESNLKTLPETIIKNLESDELVQENTYNPQIKNVLDNQLNQNNKQISLPNKNELIETDKIIKDPENIEQSILTNNSLANQINKSEKTDKNEKLIDISDNSFDTENSLFGDKLSKPQLNTDNKNNSKMTSDLLLNSVLKSDDKSKIQAINELPSFTTVIEEDFTDQSKTPTLSKNEITQSNYPGIIKINDKVNLDKGLKTEIFDKPLFLKANDDLSKIPNSKKDFFGQFIFNDNKNLFSLNIDSKIENLIQNTPINKDFNKKGIFAHDNGFIFKDNDKVYNSQITPQLIDNSQKLVKGINITPNNSILVYDEKGVKNFNPENIPNNHLLDSLSSENPLNVKFEKNSNISNFNPDKPFLLFKSTLDNSLRLIPTDSLNKIGKETEFENPLLVNLGDKKGIAFKSPAAISEDKNIKFLTLNNLVAHSEKVLNSVVVNINNEHNLIIPDNNDLKLFNIENNLDKFSNVNDKLKVKIDGKTFFVIPENETGEHVIVPEKAVITKNNYHLSEPLKVQIGKENYILNVNPQNKSLQIISENTCKSLAEKLSNPLQVNIKDTPFIFSSVDNKIYKTNINEKLINLSQDIKEPAKVAGNNLSFVVNDKNKSSVITLDKNSIDNAQILDKTTKVMVNGHESILIPDKNPKLISTESLLKTADLHKNNELNSDDILFYDNEQPIVTSKSQINKNFKEIAEPLFINKDGKEYLFIQGKKLDGLLPKESITKNLSKLENIFLAGDNQSKMIFQDQKGNFNLYNIPNQIIDNPQEITENVQVKVNDKNVLIIPEKDKLNYVIPNEKDLINKTGNTKENPLSITIDDKKYNIVFDKENPKLIDFNNIPQALKQDISKPLKVSIDNSDYIIYKSPDDNKLKILPLDKLKDQGFINIDLENINSIDISDLMFTDSSMEKQKPLTKNENTNSPGVKNTDYRLQEPKVSLSFSDGEIILKKVTKQSQSDINIENIIQSPVNQETEIDPLKDLPVLSNSIVSQLIKERNNEITENKSIHDDLEEINNETGIISNDKGSKAVSKDSSKYDVKISYDSLLNSVLSGNNDKGAIESVKGLSLFTHEEEELLLTEDENNQPLIVNIKDQKREKFNPENKYTLAQNMSGKETLIIKAADNSFKTLNLENKFQEIDSPIQDEQGNIFVPNKSSNDLFKISQKEINNFSAKNLNRNTFMKSDNEIVLKHENNYLKTNLDEINGENINLENTPVIANINGKENIILEHKGSLKQIPITAITGKIEKIKDSGIVSQDGNNFLFFKDTKESNLININTVKDFIKDPGKFNFVSLDNQKFKIVNDKVVLSENKINSNAQANQPAQEINFSKPVKVNYDSGSGEAIIYRDPEDKKIKFIDKKDINKNNLIQNNFIQKSNDNVLDNNYLILRKDSLLKFKIPNIVIDKATNISEAKEVSINGRNHIIIPNTEINNKRSVNILNNKIINRDEILNNSTKITEPFYLNSETNDRDLIINTDKGLKVFKNQDISNIGEKVTEPIIFESNNKVNVLKNELGKFSILEIENSFINDINNPGIIFNSEVMLKTNKNVLNNLENNYAQNTREEIGQSPKDMERNILTNSAFTYQINKEEKKVDDKKEKLVDISDINNLLENNKTQDIKPKNNNVSLETDLKMSGDSLLNSVLSGNGENKKIDSIKDVPLFINKDQNLQTDDIENNDINKLKNPLNDEKPVDKPIKPIILDKLKSMAKDTNNLPFVSINNQKYKIKETLLVPFNNDNKVNSNFSIPTIEINRFIKVKYQSGGAFLFKDPVNNKIKIVDTKDLIKNNISPDLLKDLSVNHPTVNEKTKSSLDIKNNFNPVNLNENILLENSTQLEKGINPNSSLEFENLSNELDIPKKNSISETFIEPKIMKAEFNGEIEPLNKTDFGSHDRENTDIKINSGVKKDVIENNSFSTFNPDIDNVSKEKSSGNLNTHKDDSTLKTDEKIIIQSPKDMERNILTNSAFTYQINKSNNNLNNEDQELNDIADIDYSDEDNSIQSIKPKNASLDIKNDLKMSSGFLLNSVLSGNNGENKKVDSVKDLSLFTGEVKDQLEDGENENIPSQKENLVKENTFVNKDNSVTKTEAKLGDIIKNDKNLDFSSLITYGKEKKIIINDNGQLKEIDTNNLIKNEINHGKPLLINHRGEKKLLSVDKGKLINIDKIDVNKLYDNLSHQETKKDLLPKDNKIKSKDSMTVPQMEMIKSDIIRAKEIITNIVNSDILEKPQDLSKQVNQMSMMFGALESQVKTLKKELEPFKREVTDEESEDGLLSQILPFNHKTAKSEDKRADKKSNYAMKTSFESLLKSVLSEVYSKVEKVSLNLQGREILSNNEKCFCIPVSIPVGQLRFNGEIMVKSDNNSRNRNKGGKSLSITLSVETKTLNTVVIDLMNLDKELQISIKVDNENVRTIFNEKIEKLNEMLKGSSYNIKPVTCSVNQNKGRSNSLLIQRDTFPKSLKRIEGII